MVRKFTFMLVLAAVGTHSISMAAPLALTSVASKKTSTAEAEAAAPHAEKAPAYKLYDYFGDRYRDPFIPLVGESRFGTSTDQPPSIASLTLKGIMEDVNGRIALLTSGYSSYLARQGRLYDGRNRVVKGISGIVKAHSVVLIGSDHTVRELKVKTAL